jgi:hypothetical protein
MAISSKPTSSPAKVRFGRQNGRDREHSALSPRGPSRIDIKPCDTLTHTPVELLAGRLDSPSLCVPAWLELTSSVLRLR